MGSANSFQIVKQHFPPNMHIWKSHSTNKYQNHTNNSTRVIDTVSHIIGQKNAVVQFQSLQYQLRSYIFRKTYPQCLVTVYDIILHAPTKAPLMPDCINNEHNQQFQVVLESIPYRLSDIGVVRFQEMVYILSQCFKALNLLWIQYGKAFYIDQDYIYFNHEGKCKIWINQNLIKNTPNIQANFLPETIIKQIFQVLQNRISQMLPQRYLRFKQSFQFDKFSSALNFVQKIIKRFNIQTDCIEQLKYEQQKKPDSLQNSLIILRQNLNKMSLGADNRCDKISLKNPKSSMLNRLHNKKNANVSNKNTITTDISFSEIEGANFKGQQKQQKWLRSTFKSVKKEQKGQRIIFTEYSQKRKRKDSHSKQSSGFKMNLNFK